MASIELRGATDAGQLEELAPILSWAFGRTPAEVLKWLLQRAMADFFDLIRKAAPFGQHNPAQARCG